MTLAAGMHVAFLATFGTFLVLMAVLVVLVLRFAVRQGRRGHPRDAGELDEASSAALVDDPDEGGDA